MKLRPLELKDAEGMLEWMKDPDINRFFRFDADEMTIEDVNSFIKNAAEEFRKGTTRHYAVADAEDVYLGTISLKNIDLQAQNAEYAISLRSCAQGKGVGMEATKQILKIAFEELGLERVYLNVLSENTRAARLYEKAGFVCEGEFRKHLYLKGKLCSLKWYGMLKEEYEGSFGEEL